MATISEHGPPSERELRDAFGSGVTISPLASDDRMGRRVAGIDLSKPLSAEQASLVVALLDWHNVVSFPAQHEHGLTIDDLERIANHFGAPIPHPYNYANYAEFVKTGVPLELHRIEDRTSAHVNSAFPGVIECVDGADSPAAYIVTNLVGSGPETDPVHIGGQHWHTDIEFQPVPLSTSMFYVQRSPTTRDSGHRTWVTNPPREEGFYHRESPARLAELREQLPLNGETAYADTAAAFATFNEDEQEMLEHIEVRRRHRVGDPGWLVPLVHTNPRTGRKSLHSPIWASRGERIAPAEIDGMSDDESRRFLDRLEEHCLQPEFRYDHLHTPGDVTIWSNFATLHNSPPRKSLVNDPGDARLLYRISCKGDACLDLPRNDDAAWVDENIVPPYVSPVG